MPDESASDTACQVASGDDPPSACALAIYPLDALAYELVRRLTRVSMHGAPAAEKLDDAIEMLDQVRAVAAETEPELMAAATLAMIPLEEVAEAASLGEVAAPRAAGGRFDDVPATYRTRAVGVLLGEKVAEWIAGQAVDFSVDHDLGAALAPAQWTRLASHARVVGSRALYLMAAIRALRVELIDAAPTPKGPQETP